MLNCPSKRDGGKESAQATRIEAKLDSVHLPAGVRWKQNNCVSPKVICCNLIPNAKEFGGGNFGN